MPKVLIVEDDEGTAKVMAAALRAGGYEVFAAVTAVEALGWIEREHPDALVADIKMPGASGVTLLEHLRAQPETHHLPVMIYTATGDDESRAAVERAGRTAYLVKPVDPVTLVERLRELLDG